MIDPEIVRETLHYIEASQRNYPVLFPIISLAAWITGFVQVVEYIRLAIRDRIHSAPLPVILYLFADDMAVVLLRDRWFNEIGHPFFIQMWYGFWLSTVLELTVIFLMLRHSRARLFPGLTLPGAIAAYAGLQLFAFVFLLWLNDAMSDHFFLLTPMLCNVISLAGAMDLLIQRRSRLGLSITQGWALVAVNTLSNFLFFPMVSQRFHTPYFTAFAVAVTAFGLVYMYMLWRAPAVEKAVLRDEGGRIVTA
nr:hypothetical protein [Sphingomonas sp. CDS-1]